MGSAKAAVGRIFVRFLFRDSAVSRVDVLTPRFRRVVLAGAGLQGARWTPGDKVQVFLESGDLRTFTPTRWDAVKGETELICYVHGDTPGCAWARSLAPGVRVQLFGPRGSLRVGGESPAVVFGDETSVGLALANGASAPAVLEVDDVEETRTALAALGMQGARVVQRREDGSHAASVAEALAAGPGEPRLVFSGRAAGIQGVRRAWKARGGVLAGAQSKAYWAPGKVGLD